MTKKTEYGLQLLVYLAEKDGQGPVSLKEVAKSKKLPVRFLGQVATKLKKAKFLKSKEGVGGGYFLAKKPKKIEVADVLEVLEGPIELVECLQKGSSCPWAGMCGQQTMFAQIKGKMKKIIEAHTLADLVGKKDRKTGR
ncbi:RrF2 family transcriptional regulator [Patescibacteria group bacterium]